MTSTLEPTSPSGGAAGRSAFEAILPTAPVGAPAAPVTEPAPADPAGRGRRASLRGAAAATVPGAVEAAMAAAVVAALAGPSPAGAGLVAGWLVLLGRERRTAGPFEPDRVRARTRCAATLGLACWACSGAGVLPWSSSQLLLTLVVVVLASILTAAVSPWSRRRSAPRVAVVGTAQDLNRELAEVERTCTVAVVCVPDAEQRALLAPDLAAPVVIGLAELAPDLAQRGADAVLAVPGHQLAGDDLRRLCWALEDVGIPMLVSSRLRDVAGDRARLTQVAGLNVVHVRPAGRRGTRYAVKSIGDRLAAAVGLVALVPLLAAVALAIRLESPGPVLFRQRRTGLNGTTFTLYKFRTMVLDAESQLAVLAGSNTHVEGPLFKMRVDPRVTRVGRFLRRYSLDELPQLLNILRGDMSLVGPRPALPHEVARYEADPRRRLVVRPGLTGLWQVSGRSDLSWEQSVRLDLQYVDNWSLRLDLAILWRTVGAVLAHRGAY